MKSREKYQASIFAKRDALLAKRRKRISQTAAALSIVICFAAAFAFLPQRFGKKLDSEVFPQITDNAATESETYAQASEDSYTFYSPYEVTVSAAKDSTKKAVAAATKPIDEDSVEITQIHLPNQQTEIAKQAEETTAKGFGGLRPEQFAYGDQVVAVYTRPEGAPDYTSEEIAEKAKTYLSDDLAAEIIDKHTMVTVRHFATPPDYYVVWFYTDNKQIKVTLNSENLDLIEKEEISLSTEEEIRTTPAYIPTTAKSAMTAALPAYIPE